jgi:hypothetical protein
MIYVMVDVLKHGRIFRDSIYHLPVTRMEFNNPELDINGMWLLLLNSSSVEFSSMMIYFLSHDGRHSGYTCIDEIGLDKAV